MSKIDPNEMFDLRMTTDKIGKRSIVGFLKNKRDEGVVLAREQGAVFYPVGFCSTSWGAKDWYCWIPVDSLEFPKPEPELPRAELKGTYYYVTDWGDVAATTELMDDFADMLYGEENYFLSEEDAKKVAKKYREILERSKREILEESKKERLK